MAEQKLSCEDNLLQVQEEILSITKAVGDCGDRISSGIITRLIKVDADFQELKQQYDEVDKITHLNAIKIVDLLLKTLHALMEIKSQEVSAHTPIDIANEIRNRNFEKAEALMRNRKQLPSKIVNEVYAGKQENTDIILDFAKFVSSNQPTITESVLKALKFEMRANNHSNPYKMMKLVETFETHFVDQSTWLKKIKVMAKEEIKEMHTDIVEAASKIFQSALYSNMYQNNVDVETLANALDTFNSDVSDKVMQKVVTEAFSQCSAVRIANNIYSSKNTSQIVAGLVALFKELRSVSGLDHKAVLNIGYYLKRLVEMKDYTKISVEKKKAVNEVIDEMPICAKNLFFADTICIRNKKYNEYLYVDEAVNKYSRSIYTWREHGKVNQGHWIAKQNEKNDGLFTFENVFYKNKYMQAGVYNGVCNRDRRYVQASYYVGVAWKVELCGDYCYLRNNTFNEYLYASGELYDSEKRYVFTRIKGSSSLPDQFKWQIMQS